MESMPFAFFATRYYKLQSGQKATVNPESNIGEDSDEAIVEGGTMAPVSMKLTNNLIMKKRSDGSKVAPLLLPSQCLDNYGERMLFQPWRSHAELIEEVSEEERAQQKLNRLSLFPMGVFPRE